MDPILTHFNKKYIYRMSYVYLVYKRHFLTDIINAQPKLLVL